MPPGVFGLLGPNGAGKTTLMKILATLLEPDAGTVYYPQGSPATRLDESEKPDYTAYFRVYGLILLPGTIFVTAVAVLANIVLRNKHVTLLTPSY